MIFFLVQDADCTASVQVVIRCASKFLWPDHNAGGGMELKFR